MFAATTTETLSIADPALLKKAPSSIPSCLDLIEPPTASSWSPENTFLFISSASTIHRYDPSSNILRDVYHTNDIEPIQELVIKDKSTVIFATGANIHILDGSEIIQTFSSHDTPITSLSLSNDNTLLASTSLGAIHVYNLALGSHTALRGLPTGTQDVNTAIFHPHSRTRLLVASGKQLLVYDTTRPSGPTKSIPLTESASGDIIAVACSPFSKSLVAIATSIGFVGLIDLDKEKALFRTLNVKTQLTSIEFSPEGTAIYLGTENGKVLVVGLRALDKPPKAVVVSQSGSRIQTISMQKKAKAIAEVLTKTPTTAATTATKNPAEPLPTGRRTTSSSSTMTQTSKSASKVAPSPARARVGKAAVASSPIVRRIPSSVKEGIATGSPVPKKAVSSQQKKILSPVRDPHGNSGSAGDLSVQLDELASRRGGKHDATPVKPSKRTSVDAVPPRASFSPRASTISTGKAQPSKGVDAEKPRRARTLPSTTTSTSTRQPSRKVSAMTASEVVAAPADHLNVPSTSPLGRPRSASSASRAGTDVTSATHRSSRPSATSPTSSSVSAARPSSSTSRPGSSVSRESGGVSARTTAVAAAQALSSRTSSPEVPDRMEPVTPIAASKQQKSKKVTGMGVLGLGTPEVDKWVRAGQQKEGGEKEKTKSRKEAVKGKGKTVGFKDEDQDVEDEELEERERALSMQISPRRPATSGSGSTIDSWAALANSNASPNFNQSHSRLSSSPGTGVNPSGSSAHELLKTIVQDVMFDFQRENKAEMMGLHLDLLRMGRGWKMELKTLMDEYVGDLRELREENERLRKENERLRRGWD